MLLSFKHLESALFGFFRLLFLSLLLGFLLICHSVDPVDFLILFLNYILLFESTLRTSLSRNVAAVASHVLLVSGITFWLNRLYFGVFFACLHIFVIGIIGLLSVKTIVKLLFDVHLAQWSDFSNMWESWCFKIELIRLGIRQIILWQLLLLLRDLFIKPQGIAPLLHFFDLLDHITSQVFYRLLHSKSEIHVHLLILQLWLLTHPLTLHLINPVFHIFFLEQLLQLLQFRLDITYLLFRLRLWMSIALIGLLITSGIKDSLIWHFQLINMNLLCLFLIHAIL